MTPCNKIKREIILQAAQELNFDSGPLDTEEQVDEAYSKLYEFDADALQDYVSEFRGGECETNIQPDWSRHYESKSVARKLSDGTWVGWCFWFGGGKHGEPESVPWMEDAYELTCVEEEKLVVVRTFTRVED